MVEKIRKGITIFFIYHTFGFFSFAASLDYYDKDKLPHTPETVLGIFDFDGNVYGNAKNDRRFGQH